MRQRQLKSFRLLEALILCVASGGLAQAGEYSIPVSVEDVLNRSEVVVLGRVTKKDTEAAIIDGMVVTRHTLKVEAYYKGNGPQEIDLITHGGTRHEKVGNETHPIITQAIGAEGVLEGEEILAFLMRGPGGYYFAAADGGKYVVASDGQSGERTVKLRLRKKKYMQGIALEGFKRLEGMDGGPDPAAGPNASLPLGKYQTEPIPVGQLQVRLSQILEGEAILKR
jgi:hypothetical protein